MLGFFGRRKRELEEYMQVVQTANESLVYEHRLGIYDDLKDLMAQCKKENTTKYVIVSMEHGTGVYSKRPKVGAPFILVDGTEVKLFNTKHERYDPFGD